MNKAALDCAGTRLLGLASGALFWPEARLLCVSDLHLGKAERMARRGGGLLPPYETAETLARLEADIAATAPATIVCLGDSFDDRAAAEALPEPERQRLVRLMAGRTWIWIEGNHDPGPLALGGCHRAVLHAGPLVFRHIAEAGETGEISGHYHPKVRLRGGGRRRCFVSDGRRVILPAYGTYTGELDVADPVLQALLTPGAVAVLAGPTMVRIPAGGSSRPA